jgi:fused signal recognition particle receptor
MKELEKVKRIISTKLVKEKISTLLVVDSMLGQNSLDQARLFNESTQLNGLVLTKMDATAKGGIVFAVMKELNIPVAYISFGEQLDQFKLFNAQEYIAELFSTES